VGAIETPRWSREQYEKMIETGIFPPGTRVELINGEIFRMTPQKGKHAAAIRAAEEALRNIFQSGYDVCVQLPLSLDPSSEPEPDLSVVPGSWRDYRDTHPSSAALVIEIADATLEYDRDRKRESVRPCRDRGLLDRESARQAHRSPPRSRTIRTDAVLSWFCRNKRFPLISLLLKRKNQRRPFSRSRSL